MASSHKCITFQRENNFPFKKPTKDLRCLTQTCVVMTTGKLVFVWTGHALYKYELTIIAIVYFAWELVVEILQGIKCISTSFHFVMWAQGSKH